jgi:DNA-directed RNA polymerase specialized sigma24 family protein
VREPLPDLAFEFGITKDDAEDLLQDALVGVCEYLYRLHPEATPEIMQNLMTDAFIGRVLKCRVADFFRVSKREQQLLQEYIAECHLRLPNEDEWWTFQAAYEVLIHLPECWQKVVLWRCEGHSWQEIAAWTSKPIGTFASGLERAINKACENLGYLRRK